MAAGPPPLLLDLYEQLYVLGRSQAEAATALGYSEPYISKLHARLKQEGRRDLAGLVS